MYTICIILNNSSGENSMKHLGVETFCRVGQRVIFPKEDVSLTADKPQSKRSARSYSNHRVLQNLRDDLGWYLRSSMTAAETWEWVKRCRTNQDLCSGF